VAMKYSSSVMCRLQKICLTEGDAVWGWDERMVEVGWEDVICEIPQMAPPDVYVSLYSLCFSGASVIY